MIDHAKHRRLQAKAARMHETGIGLFRAYREHIENAQMGQHEAQRQLQLPGASLDELRAFIAQRLAATKDADPKNTGHLRWLRDHVEAAIAQRELAVEINAERMKLTAAAAPLLQLVNRLDEYVRNHA